MICSPRSMNERPSSTARAEKPTQARYSRRVATAYSSRMTRYSPARAPRLRAAGRLVGRLLPDRGRVDGADVGADGLGVAGRAVPRPSSPSAAWPGSRCGSLRMPRCWRRRGSRSRSRRRRSTRGAPHRRRRSRRARPRPAAPDRPARSRARSPARGRRLDGFGAASGAPTGFGRREAPASPRREPRLRASPSSSSRLVLATPVRPSRTRCARAAWRRARPRSGGCASWRSGSAPRLRSVKIASASASVASDSAWVSSDSTAARSQPCASTIARPRPRTPRKRAGAAPWPTPCVCIGSPLPQFGTPHSRHSRSAADRVAAAPELAA